MPFFESSGRIYDNHPEGAEASEGHPVQASCIMCDFPSVRCR